VQGFSQLHEPAGVLVEVASVDDGGAEPWIVIAMLLEQRLRQIIVLRAAAVAGTGVAHLSSFFGFGFYYGF